MSFIDLASYFGRLEFTCIFSPASTTTMHVLETARVASDRQTHGSTAAQLFPDLHQSQHSTSRSQTRICDPGPKCSKYNMPDSWKAVPASAFHIRKPIRRKAIVIAAKFGNHPASAIKVSLPSRRHFTGGSSYRDSVGVRRAVICSDNVQPVEDAQDVMVEGFGSQSIPETSAVSEHLRPHSRSPSVPFASQLSDNKGSSGPGQTTAKDGVVFAMDVERVLLRKEEKSESASPAHAHVRQKVTESDEGDFLFAMDVEGLLLEEDQVRHKGRKRKTPQSVYSSSASEHQLTDASSHTPGCYEDQETVRRQKRNWKKRKPIRNRGRTRVNDEDQSKSKKPLPNAFVSVRIPSAEIRGKMKEIQDAMLEKEKKVKSTFVSLNKLHITLMVLKVDGNETLHR